MPVLIRRITQDIRNQDWVAVILDFVVVVIGILVAVQVEEWRQFQNDRAEERQVLSSISRELSADAEEIKAFTDWAEKQAATMNSLLKSLQGGARFEPDSIAQTLIDAIFMRILNFKSPTYDGLKDSGRLSIILEEELRNDIVSYYEGAVPFLQRRKNLATEQQMGLIDKSIPWFFRSSIDESFPGWTVVEVEVPRIGDVWRYAVADSISEIAKNTDWIAAASNFSFSLTEFGYRATTVLQRIDRLQAAIGARLSESE